ncbi:hypothetical protein PSECIP111951_00431 [Pseudoalteromonas holothuriae]|uniref:Carrier domain-containing protein n=1 Tax=Pseudoalteromonas holothuriae TaxID=2963714 RepID=A0ABM9GDV5_9GAMM|nr:beta-ketoacyl synthase N-terminal-like domain-containing protein [Pseudoalteromonas sp. CIP111951]CAH9051621.1 hypothetical protein PSECIP111951_00431 [Pseudoalteromonas sp. CIP111951]
METVTGLEVAIVGMAARVPGASSLDEYWENLLAGKDVLKMQQQRYPDQSANLGGVLDNVHGFDAGFFDVAAREACMMDPQLRQSMEISWHALEDAGVINQRTQAHIGVYAGAPTSAYLTHGISHKDKLDSSVEVDELIHHNSQELFASKLAYQLGLNGPALSLMTGCSTSFVLLHYACLALNGGDCEHALVVASRIGYPHYEGYTATPGGPLSPDGLCRPFANNATGMVPGSGALAIVLKRYEDALADGDRIYSVIRGSALNNDGRDKLGYAAPSVNGQAEVAIQAMANADVQAHEVSYVEAHGTGTELGDGVELRALQQVYGQNTANQFCALGSVKGNIGHLDAASGLASLVKVSLMLHHRQLLPTINCEQPLEQLSSANSPFYLQKEVTPWSQAKPLIAGLNIFGIGGTNGHVLLQRAESVPIPQVKKAKHILFMSAKDPQAVLRNRDSLLVWLNKQRNCNLPQLSWTLLNAKEAMPYRLAISICSSQDTHALQALSDVNIIKADTQQVFSIRAFEQNDLIVWERLFENDEVLNAKFKHHLSELSFECEFLCKSTSIWHQLRVKTEENSDIEKLLNHAAWLSILSRLSQMGIEFKQLHASGPLFITLAQWAGVLTSNQALALLINRQLPDVATLSTQNRYTLLCNDSNEPVTAKHWQFEAFWHALCEACDNHHLTTAEYFQLTPASDLHALIVQLWCNGSNIDSERFFEQRFSPASIPGYAFATTRYKLPLNQVKSIQWREQNWSKVASRDALQSHTVLLMPSGKAVNEIKRCFSANEQNVWYVHYAPQFKVSGRRTLYADLTQAEHFNKIQEYVLKQSQKMLVWVDARLSLFCTEPSGWLNAAISRELRTSWQALDSHVALSNTKWMLLYVGSSSKAKQGCIQIASYTLGYLSKRYQELGLVVAPKTLQYDIKTGAAKRFQNGVISSAMFAQVIHSDASQFKVMHKQLFAASYTRFMVSDKTTPSYRKVVYIGIEQPRGVAIARTLPITCEHIHVVLPVGFPIQLEWEQWLEKHVEGNVYSQIITLLKNYLDEGVNCSWHTDTPKLSLHKQRQLLNSDLCINLVATEPAFSQPENVLRQVTQRAGYSKLLAQLSKNSLLSALVLLQGPCTAALTSSTEFWHQQSRQHTFSSLVLAGNEINAEQVSQSLKSLAKPLHRIIIDELLLKDPSSVQFVEQAKLLDNAQYIPRPELDTPFEAPSTSIEKRIAQIWQSYFYITPIGLHDDFFSLHGHSLLALKIVNRLNAQFSTQLSLKDVLERPTVAKLSELVATHSSLASEGVVS